MCVFNLCVCVCLISVCVFNLCVCVCVFNLCVCVCVCVCLISVCVQAVENPSCAEIRDVLSAAGVNVLLEV